MKLGALKPLGKGGNTYYSSNAKEPKEVPLRHSSSKPLEVVGIAKTDLKTLITVSNM